MNLLCISVTCMGSTLNRSDIVASFPGLPCFSSSVCVQHNTQKWKSGEKRWRPGSTYHVTWTWGGCRGGEGARLQIRVQYTWEEFSYWSSGVLLWTYGILASDGWRNLVHYSYQIGCPVLANTSKAHSRKINHWSLKHYLNRSCSCNMSAECDPPSENRPLGVNIELVLQKFKVQCIMCISDCAHCLERL